MKVPAKDALLRELEAVGHGARMARVAQLGNAARGTPELEALIRSLETDDWYEAGLALGLAASARSVEPLLRALRHRSVRVRSRAATLVAEVADEAQVLGAIDALTPDGRRRAIKQVALRRRGALAASLFPRLLSAQGAGDAALLLPAFDGAQLGEALAQVGHVVTHWAPLSWRHPDAVLAFVEQAFARAPERERASLFFRYGSALAPLATLRPAAVLALVAAYGQPDALPPVIASTLGVLTRSQPEQVLALLTRPELRSALESRGLPRGVVQEAHLLSPEQRKTLARLVANAPAHLAALLGAVAPSARAELFEAAYGNTPPRTLPHALLAVLPHALRDAQAARMLALQEVQDDPAQRVALLAFRSIDSVRAQLNELGRASKAEDRAAALRTLIASTGLSRRGLPQTLEGLARLKNDQDPVRLEALQALAAIPAGLFTDAEVPALSALVGWVVDARDTSAGTRAALQQLAFRMITAQAERPESPLFQWALETLQRLTHQAGQLSLPSLARNLPRGAELRIVSALLGWMRDAAKREDYRLSLALTAALGERAHDLELLQAMLKPALTASPEWVASLATTLWLAPPKTRDVRVRALLDRDETAIALEPVLRHLHLRRQEWLEPYLQGRPLKGRYLQGKGGYVPALREGFFRWHPRQQRPFAQLLRALASDGKRGVWERTSALETLPRLQVVEQEQLAPFLASDSVPVVEAALAALAWLDRPQNALPVLLENLDTDRARVAMYAIPRVARVLPTPVVTAAVAELLGRDKLKITVRKEALRLLGAYRSEQSLPLLLAERAKPQVHRDVRIALGHAARRLLDEAGAWPLVEALAVDPDPAVARSLLDQSRDAIAPALRPRFARLLLTVARHPELAVRRAALQTLLHWSDGIEAEAGRAAAGPVLDLAQGGEWREALGLLVQLALVPGADGPLREVARGLVRAVPGVEMNATVDRDLPARQRLLALCRELLGMSAPLQQQHQPLLAGIAETVGEDASLWLFSAALRLASVRWNEVARARAVLEGLLAEIAREPLYVPLLATEVFHAAQKSTGWTAADLLALTDALDHAPMVGIQLTVLAGVQSRWSVEAAERLRRLRAHPSAAVQATARAVVTHVE